ncbi:DUF1338 domain-containing protein [Sphingobium vermicomposti]|uniref:2-oxoadipate dioxygenase/decarboxylase n=1 Tax=Sphingobium vermicomposti TaxID=529005 RepID=A0A846M489_9SPHN|nr:DUF1338 domain-containing protein [Sphingobium vermicomposti]NIJ15928.1 hypothetical protein [Sphingobium vermicomposti]
MMFENEGVRRLVIAMLGEEGGCRTLDLLTPMMTEEIAASGDVTRAQIAAAMNIVLFAGLLDRVPSAAGYVGDAVASGRRLCFDHGAIRTIAFAQGGTGALPRGEQAFRRFLEPLGYEDAATYPLPALRMTGRAYRHRDFPETIPQFFVSELHVDQFDEEFGAVADRVFGTSRDPLDAEAVAALDRLAAGQTIPFDSAVAMLPTLVAAFGCHHAPCTLEDYERLRSVSAEAAWIATEGNAFNHATDRVADVVALAEEQRALGRPIKDKVEFSRTGRVRQTAFRADMVERCFATASGEELRRMVPGSFYEFISRDVDPATGALDLSFDSGNATGIFHMTKQ